MLCDKATDENYNFEAGMKKQEEKDGKVEASAVTEAKKQDVLSGLQLSARHFTHGDTADVGGVFERGDKHLGRALYL